MSVLACLRADPAADPTQFADTTIALGLVDPELRSDLDGLDAYHHVELSRRHRASPDHASRATSVSRRAIARLVGHLHQALTPAWATFYSPTPVAAMGARHRIVDEDPLTGRHFVRLGDHAWRTTHRDDVRSAQIIDELNTILVGADNVITHRWQAGDLVVYDNRMILHRRLVEGAARASRTLRRVLVIPPEAN